MASAGWKLDEIHPISIRRPTQTFRFIYYSPLLDGPSTALIRVKCSNFSGRSSGRILCRTSIACAAIRGSLWLQVLSDLAIAAALLRNSSGAAPGDAQEARHFRRLRGVFVLLEVFFGLRATTHVLKCLDHLSPDIPVGGGGQDSDSGAFGGYSRHLDLAASCSQSHTEHFRIGKGD